MNLLYFANPMCSWCWGFAPVIQALQAKYPDLHWTVATGALGAASPKPMRQKDKDAISEHWRHVIELTGQPFDFAFFERTDFIYETRPACAALALIRAAYPALSTVFLHRLHERFYQFNDDITDMDRLSEIAAEFGQDRSKFRKELDNPDLKAAIQQEWEQTATMGVTGYPMLLAMNNGKAHMLAVGCQPLDKVEATLMQAFQA